MKVEVFTALGVLLLSVGACFGQLIVTDGTFTSPSNGTYTSFISGTAGTTIGKWQFGTTAAGTTGGVIPSSVTSGSGIVLVSPDKAQGSGNAEAFVQQNLGSLATSRQYTLTFNLANTGVSGVEVFVNGVSRGSFSNAAATFSTKSVTFTGIVGNNTLRFETNRLGNTAQYVAFDLNNVSVSATTPEPSSVITAFLLLGGICVVDRRRIRGLVRRSRKRCQRFLGWKTGQFRTCPMFHHET